MGWNCSIKHFELITSYENSAYCKPNPEYYTDIAKKLGVAPEECLMIGNDVLEEQMDVSDRDFASSAVNEEEEIYNFFR